MLECRLTPLPLQGVGEIPLDFIRYKRRALEIGEALYVPYPSRDAINAMWNTTLG